MSKYRAAIALSMTALAVAVLGQTPIGHAAVGAVRVAVFAENAGRVNNIQASRRPMPGRLVPLNARGKLPSSVLPNRSAPGGYTHTLIVSPNADPVQAGRSLREVVSGIADPSASNAYLVKIEPGIYDLEEDSLFMRPYVDIEGSGEGITTITSEITTGSGTVVGANNSELRYLTVKNTGGAEPAGRRDLHRDDVASLQPCDRDRERRKRELRDPYVQRHDRSERCHLLGFRRRPIVRSRELQQRHDRPELDASARLTQPTSTRASSPRTAGRTG